MLAAFVKIMYSTQCTILKLLRVADGKNHLKMPFRQDDNSQQLIAVETIMKLF
jgi:hypothetical protein